MNDTAIMVKNLSKRYRIGASQAKYRTLRDSLADSLGKPFRHLRAGAHNGHRNAEHTNEFWALQDVSFEIKYGEVVGIIGRNGAGKSTLLKILSRITEPSSGTGDIYGRVGSLLEVGTGFHPELTGRENIYLNGAILGMKREEIARQFDAIVEFAEVEKFIDTAVKHYSSGMYLRLAFAVAAHLEPEILLVDEVLAVGDQSFQRKCLGKMGEIGKQGRTVVIVSHDMSAIASLATKSILLHQGRVVDIGEPSQVIQTYLQSTESQNRLMLSASTRPDVALEDIQIHPETPTCQSSFEIRFAGRCPNEFKGLNLSFSIRDAFMKPIVSSIYALNEENIANNIFSVNAKVESFPLVRGTYYISAGIWRPGENIHIIEPAIKFEVQSNPLITSDIYKHGEVIALPFEWSRS